MSKPIINKYYPVRCGDIVKFLGYTNMNQWEQEHGYPLWIKRDNTTYTTYYNYMVNIGAGCTTGKKNEWDILPYCEWYPDCLWILYVMLKNINKDTRELFFGLLHYKIRMRDIEKLKECLGYFSYLFTNNEMDNLIIQLIKHSNDFYNCTCIEDCVDVLSNKVDINKYIKLMKENNDFYDYVQTGIEKTGLENE